MPWLIRTHGEVYRWLVPSVLHYGFCHFCINIILQISLGTVVESALGPLRMWIFYLNIMFGSNLFGSVVTPTYAIGSDPIIYGFIACLFTLILIYWDKIGGTTCTKVCTIFMIVMVLVIVTLLISQTSS